MAPNSKFSEKTRPIKAAPAKAPASPRSDAAEPLVIEPVEPVVARAAAAPIAPPPEVRISAAVSTQNIDVKALPLKALDLLGENAAALFDFAAELGKVKSLADAIDLQSRFASERYSTFLRQSDEIAELTRQVALGAISLRHSYGAIAT
jgi:cell division septation protein DedD